MFWKICISPRTEISISARATARDFYRDENTYSRNIVLEMKCCNKESTIIINLYTLNIARDVGAPEWVACV